MFSQEIAENVITVPEVIKEIKSKRQVRRLVTLPYDIQVKDPNVEHIQFVSEFSKKTGDYLSLSSADLKVIALTYQFEIEKFGKCHLKSEPLSKETVSTSSYNAEEQMKTAFGKEIIPEIKFDSIDLNKSSELSLINNSTEGNM